MKNLLLILLCSSCQSWSQAGDVLMPDELTLGRGSTSGVMNGGYRGHQPMFDYEAESESTYAALTWDIPSFGGESGLTREERHELRELAVERERLAAMLEEGESTAQPNTRGGADPPPAWVLISFAAALIVAVLVARRNSKKSRWTQ